MNNEKEFFSIFERFDTASLIETSLVKNTIDPLQIDFEKVKAEYIIFSMFTKNLILFSLIQPFDKKDPNRYLSLQVKVDTSVQKVISASTIGITIIPQQNDDNKGRY